MLPLLIRSSYFEDVISSKPFNSIDATSPLIISMVFLLSGPQPTCLFPGSYPTLLIFPEFFKFVSKIDVRMNYHQSNVFLQDLSNSFHHWLNLFLLILPECLNNSWWCLSSSFSTFEDRRRVFPPYLIRSLRDSWF